MRGWVSSNRMDGWLGDGGPLTEERPFVVDPPMQFPAMPSRQRETEPCISAFV